MTKIAYVILAAGTLTVPATALELSCRTAATTSGNRLVASDLHSRCQTDMPGRIELVQADMLAELIRAPVFAAGGLEVGEVADISFDDEGRPQRLRVTVPTNLGFGTRTVEIPNGTFIVLRGAVVLDLTPEAVRLLPNSDNF